MTKKACEEMNLIADQRQSWVDNNMMHSDNLNNTFQHAHTEQTQQESFCVLIIHIDTCVHTQQRR